MRRLKEALVSYSRKPRALGYRLKTLYTDMNGHGRFNKRNEFGKKGFWGWLNIKA